MKSTRRAAVGACLCAIGIVITAMLPLVASAADTSASRRMVQAEDYPHKPIRIIDAFPAGGSTDAMARLIGQKLTERFGQATVVDNRAGAAGNVGAAIAANASPDGYTLFLANVSFLASSVSLYPQLGYDVGKDFAYITLVAYGTYVMVVTASLPVKSVADLIALAKSRPGQLRYGSGGVGSIPHLAGELFKRRAGVDILHVPYKGAAPAVAAVASNEIQITYSSLAAALPLINAGRVTPLAIFGTKRDNALPAVPTIAESGFSDLDVTPWYGLLAPAATPGAIVKALNTEIISILELPDIQTAFAKLGFQATGSTPAHFKEIMRSEIAKSGKIIKSLGIKLN